MAKIVSLSTARKSRDRVKKRAKADENAVKFGLTKSQKSLNKARGEKSARDHDGLERE
ncbi:DUF4169 family protein [Aliiroseovarius subalbicans]|uniref:DUF4169 family protein n=1 Tax=Aliiroseovarius subalbicans TaxID=2925840 RepID=UPI001F5A8B59|nr:DUF4169 family protein [Aliiroseovarius subalbicans]MCI2398541.1 DUF4169 family protein [Aliiroseovarius subalbicans]